MDAVAILVGMAENNAWANHRLLGACAKLSQEEWVATRTSFFPSLRETLLHIYLVDRYYLDALEAKGRGRAIFDDMMPFTECAPLREAQRASDAELVRFVASLAGAGESVEAKHELALAKKVKIPRRDGDQYERVDRVLLHLFEHQLHHRGQAHAMLAGTNVAPPPLDEFFLEAERPLREAELRELGLALR